MVNHKKMNRVLLLLAAAIAVALSSCAERGVYAGTASQPAGSPDITFRPFTPVQIGATPQTANLTLPRKLLESFQDPAPAAGAKSADVR